MPTFDTRPSFPRLIPPSVDGFSMLPKLNKEQS
jgi:hypothetical protein